MTAVGVREAVRTASGPEFRSAGELRDVLDLFLASIDGDAELGARLRATRVPHRLVFPDLDVVLNVTESDRAGHFLRWKFSDRVDWVAALTLEMESRVANRYMQGRENFAIAVARDEIRVSCDEVRSALNFLPTSMTLISRYRALIESDYPHLLID